MEIIEALQKLTEQFGSVGAVAILGWIWERRTNRELQKRLLRLAAAQMSAAGETRAAIETIKEILRR